MAYPIPSVPFMAVFQNFQRFPKVTKKLIVIKKVLSIHFHCKFLVL